MSGKRYTEEFKTEAAKQHKTRIKRVNTTCDLVDHDDAQHGYSFEYTRISV